MRSRVRIFVAVGMIVTTLDLLTLYLLEPSIGFGFANTVALVAAAMVSYLLNRTWTFKLSSAARWVSDPSAFFITAFLAGLVDLAVSVSVLSLSQPVLLAKVLGVGAASLVRWSAYRTYLFRIVRSRLSTRSDQTPAPGELRLSMVLPAYNEGERISESISSLNSYFSSVGIDSYEILVIDDASTDDTSAKAEAAGARVVSQPKNTGKGGAVRRGMQEANGRTVLFTDSDLAYPPKLVPSFLESIESGWDMAVGSRRHPDTDTKIKTTLLRRAGGWCVNKLTYFVLLGQFRDTQCGIKAFRSDVAKSMADRLQLDGFGFDVELFLMAELDHISLIELPVEIKNRPGSSVSLVGDTIQLFLDLVKVRRWAGRGLYTKSVG